MGDSLDPWKWDIKCVFKNAFIRCMSPHSIEEIPKRIRYVYIYEITL